MTAAPSTTSIDHDLPCPACNYNLRGLQPDGLCPECQSPIALAFRGDALRHSDPAWLEGVGHAIGNFKILVWLPLFLPQLFPAGGFAFYFSIVLIAFYAGAIWRLTRAEPGVFDEHNAERLALRALAASLFVLPALMLSAEFWTQCLTHALTLVEAAIICLCFQRLRRLSRRLPDYPLARRIAVVRWLIPTTWLATYTTIALVSANRPVNLAVFLGVLLATFAVTTYALLTLWWLRLYVSAVIVATLHEREYDALS